MQIESLTDFKMNCDEFVENVNALRMRLAMEADGILEQYKNGDFGSRFDVDARSLIQHAEIDACRKASDSLELQAGRVKGDAPKRKRPLFPRAFRIAAGISGIICLGIGASAGFHSLLIGRLDLMAVSGLLLILGVTFSVAFLKNIDGEAKDL